MITAARREVVIQSYCWPWSATKIALYLNEFYRCRSFSASSILEIWNEEIERNALLDALVKQYGERPFDGHAQTDEIKFARHLLAGREATLAPSLPQFAHGKNRSLQGGSSA